MRVTKLVVGRTYNTGNYTSQRFEMEAKLVRGEDVLEAQRLLARDLHAYALVTMADHGVQRTSEPGGNVPMARPNPTPAEDHDDDIPY